MAILWKRPGEKKLNLVPLARSGLAYDTELVMVGASLTRKYVVAPTNISVLQMFLSSPEVFIRTDSDAAPSAALSKVWAVTFDLLRSDNVYVLSSSLFDAAFANNLNDDRDFRNFYDLFEASGTDDGFAEGQVVSVIIKNGKQCNVTCETNSGAWGVGKSGTVAGSANLGRKLISLWLGIPPDAHAAEVKKNVLAFLP